MSVGAKELTKLCDQSLWSIGKITSQPWAIDLDGLQCVIATNGAGILVLREASELEQYSTVPRAIADAVRPARDARRVSARRLLSFISYDVHDDTCPVCDGDGEMECSRCTTENLCDACCGTGSRNQIRRGIIAGVLVNMALLVMFLRPLELGTDGDLMISQCADGALRVDDPDGAWTVILMRLRESDEAAGAFEDVDHPHMTADEARALVRRLDAELAEALAEEARAVSTRSPARRIATKRVQALREMRDMARTEGLVFVCSAAESAAKETP